MKDNCYMNINKTIKFLQSFTENITIWLTLINICFAVTNNHRYLQIILTYLILYFSIVTLNDTNHRICTGMIRTTLCYMWGNNPRPGFWLVFYFLSFFFFVCRGVVSLSWFTFLEFVLFIQVVIFENRNVLNLANHDKKLPWT